MLDLEFCFENLNSFSAFFFYLLVPILNMNPKIIQFLSVRTMTESSPAAMEGKVERKGSFVTTGSVSAASTSSDSPGQQQQALETQEQEVSTAARKSTEELVKELFLTLSDAFQKVGIV